VVERMRVVSFSSVRAGMEAGPAKARVKLTPKGTYRLSTERYTIRPKARIGCRQSATLYSSVKAKIDGASDHRKSRVG